MPPAPPQYAHYTTQLSKGLDICETRPHVVRIHTTVNVSENQGEKAKGKNNMQDGFFFNSTYLFHGTRKCVFYGILSRPWKTRELKIN